VIEVQEASITHIEKLLIRQKAYFYAQNTKSLPFRIKQLEVLKAGINRQEHAIIEALAKDLNKSELETFSTEIGIIYEEINVTSKNLEDWAKPKKVKTALTHIGSAGWVMPEPFGVTLIMAPWNYPVQLSLSPLIGAIAAGNTAIVKPSELTPNVSALIKRLLNDLYSEDYIAVIEGGVQTSQILLDQPFDYIFFTGSVPVGKIVMEAASKRLIPITLELGGKSPSIVHEDANIDLAAKRIVFGKFTNAGQTCIAPDYLLVHKKVKKPLVRAMTKYIVQFYGEDPVNNPNYSKIVNERHFKRLLNYLKDGDVLQGGKVDESSYHIEPTFLTNTTLDSPVMQEEIFGPIFPIIEYSTIEEVIELVRSRPKPLALYLFTNSQKVEDQILSNLSFGGGCVNDTLMHIATPHLPFGGVGESGMGQYHGKSSFEAFSHSKSVLKQTNKFDFSFRYPSAKNGLGILRKLMK
jgi:aldehyde dehydrogenase (NAD+)